MKKLVTLIVIATLALGIPTVAYAATYLRWTKNIYSISSPEEGSNGVTSDTVTMFDYGEDRCYVATSASGAGLSISCVRQR